MAWLKRTILASDASFRVLISPTPIVGPDRARGKNDNHFPKRLLRPRGTNSATGRNSTSSRIFCLLRRSALAVPLDDPLRTPRVFLRTGQQPARRRVTRSDPAIQPFHRVRGGFLSVRVSRSGGQPSISLKHHDVQGKVVNEYRQRGQ
ncbi:MAG: hypothetical protein Ct9H300mP1_32750 [Planctomycetaceae bacterium]|nr:MAG: hypothetical protein Ct9H300mP1_32750 [Planctomycetaceae bacterium]